MPHQVEKGVNYAGNHIGLAEEQLHVAVDVDQTLVAMGHHVIKRQKSEGFGNTCGDVDGSCGREGR